MNKNIYTKIHLLFISPDKYFAETILDKEFKIKDIIVFSSFLFPIITILHLIQSSFNKNYNSSTEVIIFEIGFFVGLYVSLVFRTYIITLVISKSGFDVDYKQIAILVLVSLITSIFLFLIPIIFQLEDPIWFLGIFIRIWNLFLILVGIMVLTKIKFWRAFILILLIFGFEEMVKLVFYGF
ncbi:MAG: YIP1 family protein [Saprospiraceae bacterium]|nr:YIP1 family protein [Saprospiraceae bacterium]